MNSTEIFRIALGLNSPWYVEKAELQDSASGVSKELHLHLNFERGYKFMDIKGVKSSDYDTVERMWQHLDFFKYNCYLHARIPRIKSSTERFIRYQCHGHVPAVASRFYSKLTQCY